EEVKKNDSETALRDDLVEQAASNAEMEIPQAMIDSETERMMQNFEQRLQMQGMNLDLYFQFSGQDEKTLRDQMKNAALSGVRVLLTLEAIGAAENVEVPE